MNFLQQNTIKTDAKLVHCPPPQIFFLFVIRYFLLAVYPNFIISLLFCHWTCLCHGLITLILLSLIFPLRSSVIFLFLNHKHHHTQEFHLSSVCYFLCIWYLLIFVISNMAGTFSLVVFHRLRTHRAKSDGHPPKVPAMFTVTTA